MLPATFPVTDIRCKDIGVRRRQVRAHSDVNGIDYVEVDNVNVADGSADVMLHLLKTALIDDTQLQIDGLNIGSVEMVNPEDDAWLPPTTYRIKVTGAIDPEATNTLKLHSANEPETLLPGFDPLLSEAEFSFGVDRSSDRDLPAAPPCPPRSLDEPDMHYLAKDYASFRQLILDRLALIMPQWRERHVPDLGITLIELLAYTGDYLSYYQDAVATEAYLNTARQRISVRRHARLVDYRMHEGCNARALLCLTADVGDPEIDLGNVYFITDHGLTFPLGGVISRESALKEAVRRERYEIFEPVDPIWLKLYYAHNRIDFYTWGEQECCLPKGAIRAALRDGPPLPLSEPQDDDEQYKPEPEEQQDEETTAPGDEEEPLQDQLDEVRILKLQEGDLLIFEEILDPGTGLYEDADPAHRHAVRLTKVTRAYDLVSRQAVLEIEWHRADALPFPLCLSAVTDDCEYLEGISVARGNVILVDHGETVEEDLDPVKPLPAQPTCDECGEVQSPGSHHYNPHLRQKPVVFREALPLADPAWYLLHRRDPRAAVALITLEGHDPQTGQTDVWWPRVDLLASGGDDRDFVVEVDDERVAHLRFGDDELGERPAPHTQFHARYRIGEPLAGNVGAETIRRLIVRTGIIEGVVGVRNPLEATGGVAPETVSEVKLRAPHAFRQRLLRAVTEEDYARLVEGLFPNQVQKAFAKFDSSDLAGRSNVTVWFDALSGVEGTADDMAKQIEESLYPYRRIGHDLKVVPGEHVPLLVTITVKIEERAVRERVAEAIEAALDRRGFFCPDRLTFETGISLSQMVAIAQRIPGVAYVEELVVETTEEDALESETTEEKWPDVAGEGEDLMTFKAGKIPSLGMLTVD